MKSPKLSDAAFSLLTSIAATALLLAGIEGVFYFKSGGELASPFARPFRKIFPNHATDAAVRASASTAIAASLPLSPIPQIGANSKIHRDQSAKLEFLNPGMIVVPKLGYLKPNYSGKMKLTTAGGKIIFDSPISTDEFGRRTTVNTQPQQRKKHLLVFGCSFAFGTGVGDAQTFPSQLAAHAPSYKAYNYGFPAVGPIEALARIQDTDFRREVGSGEGVGIYLFIAGHIQRSNSHSIYFATTRASDSPFFLEDGEGKLRRFNERSGRHGMPLRVFSLLGKSYALSFLGIDANLGEEELRFTARVLRELSDAYKRKFPGDRFVVVIWPDPWTQEILNEYLNFYGVEYLDYRKLPLEALVEAPASIPEDGHPTAASQKFIAGLVAKDLGLSSR